MRAWGEQDVYWTWFEGQGWIRYPVRVPVFRLATWDDAPVFGQDVPDNLVTVWCGPCAHLPNHPPAHLIPHPRQAISWVRIEDVRFPQWKSFYASKIIDPERSVAWLYELMPENRSRMPGFRVAIWKVWDYDEVR